MSELDTGTQFDFTYAPGTTIDQIVAFEMAGEIWSSYLQDNATIRIYVESTNQLPDEIVGAALPGKKKKIKYDKLWKEMSGEITSSNDQLAFDNLPSTEKEFGIIVDGVELNKTKEFKLTNANAKALDLLKDDRKKLDGYILVNDLTGNSTVGWSYDALRNDSISGNEIDLVSVAMHEIGHILGFVSGIDDDGWLEVLTESQEKDKPIKDDAFKFAAPLDLFRYSESSAALGKIDISTGGDPFFSIDGGTTRLGNFANGEYTDFGGDGYQASHWQQNSDQGIMNPILPIGRRNDISPLDLTAMDVIGWEIDTTASLDWQEMYDSAIANSETAVVEDRSKDVEKMIKESDYDGRRVRRSSNVNYSFQIGYWQYTTLEALDEPEIIVEDEAADSENDDGDNQTENNDDLFSTGQNDEDLNSQPGDDLGTAGVATDEESQDSLLSGGLSNPE